MMNISTKIKLGARKDTLDGMTVYYGTATVYHNRTKCYSESSHIARATREDAVKDAKYILADVPRAAELGLIELC